MSIVLSICYFGTLNSEFMHLFSHHLRYYCTVLFNPNNGFTLLCCSVQSQQRFSFKSSQIHHDFWNSCLKINIVPCTSVLFSSFGVYDQWVLVAHLFRCIVFFVLFAFALCPVAIVTCGSGLSILDCPVVFSNVYSFALCPVAIVTCGSGLSILDCPVVFSNVYFVSINISHFNSNKIFQLVLIRYPV